MKMYLSGFGWGVLNHSCFRFKKINCQLLTALASRPKGHRYTASTVESEVRESREVTYLLPRHRIAPCNPHCKRNGTNGLKQNKPSTTTTTTMKKKKYDNNKNITHTKKKKKYDNNKNTTHKKKKKYDNNKNITHKKKKKYDNNKNITHTKKKKYDNNKNITQKKKKKSVKKDQECK